ncbi:MAG: hypothetical protein J1G06_06495 [Oscillospiraceae bacterium]|nr:hypothetical protein [Oscillospiraceae bacterium]
MIEIWYNITTEVTFYILLMNTWRRFKRKESIDIFTTKYIIQKKNMKRIVMLLLAITISLSLCACDVPAKRNIDTSDSETRKSLPISKNTISAAFDYILGLKPGETADAVEDNDEWNDVSDWTDSAAAEEDSYRTFLPQEEIQNENKSADFSAFNGSFEGGGVPYEEYYIGRWGATISNASSDSILFSFGQSESDYYVENVMLYRQSDGSYQGRGLSTWGESYFTVLLESPDYITVTVEGNAESTGTEKLYRSEF